MESTGLFREVKRGLGINSLFPRTHKEVRIIMPRGSCEQCSLVVEPSKTRVCLIQNTISKKAYNFPLHNWEPLYPETQYWSCSLRHGAESEDPSWPCNGFSNPLPLILTPHPLPLMIPINTHNVFEQTLIHRNESIPY